MGNKWPFLLSFLYGYFVFPPWSVQENTAPTVLISTPSETDKLPWNSIVPYRIAISDVEDGSSEYDEINAHEVILTLTYLPDSSLAEQYAQEVEAKSTILSSMASSNCFTCHKAKNRLIGPSFEQIADRYNATPENTAYLTQRIREGSSGVWGDEIMPAQPELKTSQIDHILEWIFKNARDPDYTFYVGTEGAFKTGQRPTTDPGKAAYMLHAQYIDHGLNDSHEKSKKGKHTIVLNLE